MIYDFHSSLYAFTTERKTAFVGEVEKSEIFNAEGRPGDRMNRRESLFIGNHWLWVNLIRLEPMPHKDHYNLNNH